MIAFFIFALLFSLALCQYSRVKQSFMIFKFINIHKNIKYDMKIDYLTPDKTILGELGQRLARVRKQQGVTQTELAEEAGIGVATLRRIESGQSGQMDSWIKIMKALRMTASLEALLPENFDSPRAQVLSSKAYSRKNNQLREADAGRFKWGDESP